MQNEMEFEIQSLTFQLDQEMKTLKTNLNRTKESVERNLTVFENNKETVDFTKLNPAFFDKINNSNFNGKTVDESINSIDILIRTINTLKRLNK
jgi:hypothetical protein